MNDANTHQSTLSKMQMMLTDRSVELSNTKHDNKNLRTQIDELTYHYNLNSSAIDAFRQQVSNIRMNKSDAISLLYGSGDDRNYIHVLGPNQDNGKLRREMAELVRQHDRYAMELCSKFLKFKNYHQLM